MADAVQGMLSVVYEKFKSINRMLVIIIYVKCTSAGVFTIFTCVHMLQFLANDEDILLELDVQVNMNRFLEHRVIFVVSV